MTSSPLPQLESMSISELKLELMKLNDPSFLFTQRDELEYALKSARKIKGDIVEEEENNNESTVDENEEKAVQKEAVLAPNSVTTANVVKEETTSSSNNEKLPDLASVSSAGSTSRGSSQSSSVSPARSANVSSSNSNSKNTRVVSKYKPTQPPQVATPNKKKATSSPKNESSGTSSSNNNYNNEKKNPSSSRASNASVSDILNDKSSSSEDQQSVAISRRLVEYFVMVSCIPITDTKTLEAAAANKSNRKMRPPNPDVDKMNSRTKARFDVRRVHLQQQSDKNKSSDDEIDNNNTSSTTDSNNLSNVLLEPQITARYPSTDYPDQPLNLRLPQFCFPEGTSELLTPTTQYKMPRIHYFVLTDSAGGKLYGTALTVYEEFHNDDEDSSGNEAGEGVSNNNTNSNKGGKQTSTTYYAPRVLTLLSTYPYLTAFRTYLTQLYRLATTTNCMTTPIERYVQNICNEVPAPPPGAFEVELTIHPSLQKAGIINFWAPPADQPIAYVSLPFQVLFECLDIGNILFAWYTLACEQKVLLVSSQLSLLTVCGEILCSLLFPMKWCHLYIPVLPRSLSPMLDAPMPYLCGISRENFGYAVEDIGDETVVVDLDRNVITLGSDTPELPPLPHNRRKKLESTLKANVGDVFWEARNLSKAEVLRVRASGDEEKLSEMLDNAGKVWEEKVLTRDDAFNLAHAPDSASMKIDEDANDDIAHGTVPKQSKWDAVQEAFLRFYCSVLQDYRKFLPSDDDDEDGSSMKARSTWRGKEGLSSLRYQKEEFVAAAPTEFQPFLEQLSISQQFDDFVTRKMHNAADAPDIKFFDQSIDAKKNRSKLKLKKKETPFLHSACAHRDLKRIMAVQPNGEDLPPREDGGTSYVYKMWPLSFDEKLFGTPRPIPSIISAEFDRRTALKSLLRSKHNGGGGRNRSPESTAFLLFFATFTSIIGRELSCVEQKHGTSSDDSTEGFGGPLVPPVALGSTQLVRGTSTRQSLMNLDNDLEVARTIAKAQIDLGYHTLSLMRARKLPPEPIAYKLLIQACGRCKVTHRASGLMDLLARDGLATNSEIYTSLISAFSNDDSQPSSLALYQINADDNMSSLSSSERDGSTVGLLRSSSSGERGGSSGSTRLLDRHMSSSTPSEASLDLISEEYSSQADANTTSSATKSKKFKPKFSKPSFRNSLKGKRDKMKSSSKMSKKYSLRMTAAVAKQVELGHSLLESIYPGIDIDMENICPKCSTTMDEDDIYSGWEQQHGASGNEYETSCPSCSHRFVPKFSISCKSPTFEGSQGKGTPLYCDHLSPWVVLREIRSVISATGGIQSILEEKFRCGPDISATLWWNTLCILRRYKLPYTFLLQGSFHNNVILVQSPSLGDSSASLMD